MKTPAKHPLHGRGRIGVALGSGAAKGWAHIGVIRGLEAQGVRPDIICGSSMGAVVGAAYAADRLDEFEDWAESLEWTSVVGYLDLAMRGGLIKARRLFEFFVERLPDARIEDLPRPFAAVGTDLSTGQEIWMREGNLIDALRATIAVPGLITPSTWRGSWMVDGGLVNPVPVSLARALGADFVIAVDLNTTLLGRRFGHEAGGFEDEDEDDSGEALPATVPAALAAVAMAEADAAEAAAEAASFEAVEAAGGEAALVDLEDAAAELAEQDAAKAGVPLTDRLNLAFREIAKDVRGAFASDAPTRPAAPGMPSMYEVIANSINIMQVRIGRSRMAGDPPELLVTPRLSDFGLLDFERSAEAIDEGERALDRAWRTHFSHV